MQMCIYCTCAINVYLHLFDVGYSTVALVAPTYTIFGKLFQQFNYDDK